MVDYIIMEGSQRERLHVKTGCKRVRGWELFYNNVLLQKMRSLENYLSFF